MEFGRPLLTATLLFAIATVAVGIAYFYLQRRPLGRLRGVLLLLRLCALGLLVFCLLEPTRVFTREEPIRSQVAVLLDRSQSMTLEDAGDAQSRWNAARAAAERLAGSLSERFDVRSYTFDSELTAIRPEETAAPDGRSTDVLRAVEQSIANARGVPMAGVILLSDGVQNVGNLASEKSFGVPVFSVGVGSPVPPKDIAVAHVAAEPIFFIGEKATVAATVQIQGYPDRSITVSLLQNDGVVAVQTAKATAQEPAQNVTFQFTPSREGTFRYSVSVSPLLDEFTPENNRRSFTAQVLPSRTRILVVDGTPRYEFAFLRRALERVPSFDVTSVLIPTPGVSRAGDSIPSRSGVYPLGKGRFPQSLKDLLVYDVLILGNLSMTAFSATQRDWIVNFVEVRGKGIAWMAGEHWLSRRSGIGALDRLLPATLPPDGVRPLTEDFSPTLTPEGRYHAITQLAATPDENDSLWKQMPLWSRLYPSLKAKPGSTVLVTATNTAAPVILLQRVGAGKSFMAATDALWQWGFRDSEGDSDAYARFWVQAVRWLATPSDVNQVTVSVTPAQLETGELGAMTVRVYDSGFVPVSDAAVELTLTDPDGNSAEIPVALALERGEGAAATAPGQYIGRQRFTRAGTYRLSASARARGILLGRDEIAFDVEAPRLEFSRVARNDALLRSIAEKSGGVMVEVGQAASAIPPLLKESGESRAIKVRSAIWNNPLIFVLIILLLGLEWILRKRKGLV